MTTPHNIYIHVPYCMSKCRYCAFFSSAVRPDWEKYTLDMCTEIQYWGRILNHAPVPTIFFGGGTPSLMPADAFGRILDTVAKCFQIQHECEITIEANPGTIDAARLGDFQAAGMNRLSVGVQSLNDADLKFLGRRHTVNDARRLLDAGHAANLRVSADFIYGLPGQTADTVAAVCREINTMGLRHCSMYELTIEAGTPLAADRPAMPSNNEMAEMYDAIGRTLAIARYEVSNYAAPGDECRHNATVWDGAPYIGIGRGAAGRPLINGAWYEQMGAGAQFTELSRRDRAIEKVITGMRTMRGVEMTADVRDVINHDFVASHRNLVMIDGDRMHATNAGILTLDNLLIRLIG